jgi:hypothetical protein
LLVIIEILAQAGLQREPKVRRDLLFSSPVQLTGVSRREEVAKMANPPDHIINHLGELPDILAQQTW